MKIKKNDFWKAILKKKVYILVIAVIFAITGMSYTLANVEFKATKKILLESSDKLNTYKEFLTGSELLKSAIEKAGVGLSVKDVEKSLEVNFVDDTEIIEISVTGEKAEEMQAVSNEIVNSFRAKVSEIYGKVSIYVVDDSGSFHSKGNTFIVGVLTFVGGFLLSSLFFAVCILCDDKIKSCKEMEEITELKSLISIPCVKNIRKKKLNIRNIRAHNNSVFKLLMTNIQFVNSTDKSKAILITSPKSFEGKTYVATNLAIEFAKAGKKVIMIDGDMRKGRLAKIFELPNDLGLSNYLSNLNSNGNVINERINSFINDTEIRNLNVITSGNTPPNIMELLKNGKIQQLIKDLKVFYDIIIFDTTAILEAPEVMLLSEMCDLSFMMTAYGNTKIEEFTKAFEKINDVNNCMVGIGLNKIPDRKWRKQLVVFRIRLKQCMHKWFASFKVNIKKLKYAVHYLKKLEVVFEWIGTIFLKFCAKVKTLVINCRKHIKLKSQDVKEYIKNYKAKREKIRLIESGSIIIEPEEAVENELIEEEAVKIEVEEVPEVRSVASVVSSVEKTNKSKFDLMREQQEKGKVPEEIAEKQEIQAEEMKKGYEELKEKQRVEREKREEEKRLQREKIKDFKEIDFQTEETITEEMIRRQVEMDDMIRMAELEQEEERKNIKRQKLLKKNEKKKQRIAKKELKAKEKEEKKAARERAKQLYKAEIRMNEELKEDNLYPRIRM